MTIPPGGVAVHGDAQASIILSGKDQRIVDVQRCLQLFYKSTAKRRRVPEVTAVANIATGWAHEMYAFDLTHGSPTELRHEPLVLRIYAGDHACEEAERECRVMRRLHENGYPVPPVYILEQRSSPIGKAFIVMERFDGENFDRRYSRAAPGEYPELTRRFCELLVRLHEMDWHPFADLLDGARPEDPHGIADEALTYHRRNIQQHSLDGFLPIVDWLHQRRADVPCRQLSLIHGDFHLGNVLIPHDGPAVVVDWTHFSIADRRMDLAYTLVLYEAHASDKFRNAILSTYQQVADIEIQQLEWFETLARLWILEHITILLLQGGETLGMRTDAPTLPKQHMEGYIRMYESLVQRTGIHVPEFERIAESDNK